MKNVLRIFSVIHVLFALLFTAAALLLLGVAAAVLWRGFHAGLTRATGGEVVESIGYVAIAVVALQLAQTVAEEEVVREAHVSAPTRVRRYVSRFFSVVVVALAVEGLVGTFKAIESHLELLPQAASVSVAAAAILAAWGVFVRLNRSAEELEPEAMEEAKREDEKLR